MPSTGCNCVKKDFVLRRYVVNSREAAVDMAKRCLVDSVYASARIEGIVVTFPQTQQILDNLPVNGIRPNDIQFILNMREAWRFVLDTLDEPINAMYIRELNKICGNGLIYGCGMFRESIVTITGTSYIPPIPQHGDIVGHLQEIGRVSDTVDRSISYFEYLAKSQLFIDGNKRLAQLVANKVLIADGVGILKIPDTKVKKFAYVLVDYYETGSDRLYNYLLNECLQRVNFSGVVEFNGNQFTVSEVVAYLPPFVRSQYSSDEECAKANVEAYYKSLM